MGFLVIVESKQFISAGIILGIEFVFLTRTTLVQNRRRN
jgi:hypothetical protein